MHRYKMVAHISLILSILNLVLAAPIVVRGIHEAYGEEMVVAANVAAMPKKWRELKDRQTSPLTSPNAVADAPDRETSPLTPPVAVADVPDRQTFLQSSLDVIVEASDRQPSPQLSPDADASHATASPQHSTSSSWNGLDYPTPPLSTASTASGYSFLVPQSPPAILPGSPPHQPLPADSSVLDTNWIPYAESARKNMAKKVAIVATVLIGVGIVGGVEALSILHPKQKPETP